MSRTIGTQIRPYAHDWQEDARCAGLEVDLFYGPDNEDGEPRVGVSRIERQAVAFCRGGCPVIQQCKAHALTLPERHGVWGGTTPEQRRDILKRQKKAT